MKKNQLFLLLFVSGILSFQSCKKDGVGEKEQTVYSTDFSSNDGFWPTGTRSNGTILMIEGGYYALSTQGVEWNVWLKSLFEKNVQRSAIEASVKVSTIGGDTWGNGGLIWNLQGSGSSITGMSYFYISHNGQFVIGGYPNGYNKPYVNYVNWTENNVIKKEAFNKLRIENIQGTWHFYINGKEVHSMPSKKGNLLDQVGVAAHPKTILMVDYFKAVTIGQ
ncbi:hypothetical protein [Niabella beijingensis]|uniref:hypothetical protein n=1 Tax=Niabella beijingensis TaxID=2872700 RepID=UPI001CBF78DC|nr:hypothetical protein [Niabella beijingensis]MBZ4189920.1 hypothetical protein [Niabella beijingensis]